MKLDKNTLIQLKQGDETAFASIFWQYNPRVFHFISSLLYDKSLAEDLTQTVFLKIWEKRAFIDPEQGFESYLFTIARHLVYKETEKSLLTVSYQQTLQHESLQTDPGIEAHLEAESLRAYIQTLIDQLPPARREIFRLSREKHLSNKEIAAHLSLSEKTVETQLYRALRFLKQKLSDHHLLGLLLLAIIKEC